MTSQQENSLSMYYAVQDFCNQNQSIWQTNKPFKTAFDLFESKLPLINQYRDTQSLNTTGVAQVKAQKKEDLIEKAYFVANRLQSYALHIQDSELLAKVNYSRTYFSRYRDTNLTGLCNTILENAQNNLANLLDYSVDATTLSELQTAIQAYQAQLAKPRTSQTTSKTATSNLEQLFAEATTILRERLDRDIEIFRKSQPDFYQQYQSVRRVVQTTYSKLALRIEVKEQSTAVPIANVKISLAGSKETKKSTEKGNCQIKNLAQGTYQISFEKTGYLSQSLSVNIVDGETTKLVVEMEKG